MAELSLTIATFRRIVRHHPTIKVMSDKEVADLRLPGDDTGSPGAEAIPILKR